MHPKKGQREGQYSHKLVQTRFCEVCGLPFTPSKRYRFVCKGCQKSVERMAKNGS